MPLRVMNLSNQQLVINKGTELARCETIHSVLASRVDIEMLLPVSTVISQVLPLTVPETVRLSATRRLSNERVGCSNNPQR